MWRCNILFLIILGGCTDVWAQITFVASTPTPRIGVRDRVEIDFTISNVENLQEVRATSFGDFTPLEGPYGTKFFFKQ